MKKRTYIDLSHIIEDGVITHKGLPAPIICDYLSREASKKLYEPGTEFQIGKIEMVTNTGTYIDVPFHRYKDGTHAQHEQKNAATIFFHLKKLNIIRKANLVISTTVLSAYCYPSSPFAHNIFQKVKFLNENGGLRQFYNLACSGVHLM